MSANKVLFEKKRFINRILFSVIFLSIIYFPIFLHLDSKTLRTWDESRNALNAFEMTKTGNFMVKTYQFQADLWETKPPLLVWMQAIGFKILGYNELAVRLPVAMACLALLCLIAMWFYKETDIFSAGAPAALIIVCSEGFMHDHGARTGDHDVLMIFFAIGMLLYFFSFTETKKNRDFLIACLFLTLAVYAKSIAALMFLPAMLLYLIFQKRFLEFMRMKVIYLGIFFSGIAICSFYIFREYKGAGYLEAVWHNELFPRYLNTSTRYDYEMKDYFFYFKNLYQWQFSYWIFFMVPALIVNHFGYKEKMKRFHYYILLNILFYFLIISAGTVNVWYDLPLIPMMAITIGMAMYRVMQKIYLQIRTAPALSFSIVCIIFSGLYLIPYTKVIEKELSNEETNPQVMYGYAFKKLEKDYPKIKSFKVFDPLNHNYSLAFYKQVFNSEKAYSIGDIYKEDLNTYHGYILVLDEQYEYFKTAAPAHQIVFSDMQYRLLIIPL